VPVALGVLSVAIAAALGFLLLGRGGGLTVGLGLAIAPAAVFTSMVGRFDQHVLEVLCFLSSLLAMGWAVHVPSVRARRARALLLGCALAASFWSWQGSALTLLLLAFAAAADHLLGLPGEPPERRLSAALAEGALAAALLLALSIGLFGPDGALWRGGIEGVSGLGVATCAGTAIGAVVLAMASRRARSGWVRLLEIAAAAAVGAGALLSVPSLRQGLLHGLLPFGRSNPWYAAIDEFMPLVHGGSLLGDLRALFHQVGLLPVLAAAGAWVLPAYARSEPGRRTGLVLLGAVAAALLPLWFARRRFDAYAIVPLVVLGALAARTLAARVLAVRAPRWITAGAVVLLLAAAAPTATTIALLGGVADASVAPVARLAERLGAAVAIGVAQPGVVLSSWTRGHHVRVLSGLPALVTPFGSDAGSGSMEDWARFMLARSDGGATTVLDARGVRWLLLEPPEFDLLLAHRLVPLGAAPVSVTPDGQAVVATQAAASLLCVALYWRDGNGDASAPPIAGFRLVDEDYASGLPEFPAKLFERVPGARVSVTGAPPGAPVEATIPLALPSGRRTTLTLGAAADEAGRATLRLPYATGRNGLVVAGSWQVRSGAATRHLAVSEQDVLQAAPLSLSLR
jgi:asparagine N-glycosylation enzyme membrane subunit Stt3